MPKRKSQSSAGNLHRWGIVLSGGNGMRLRELIYRRRADHLPKQYLNFIGQRSMLEHTWHRAERSIPPKRLLTVLNREHLQYDEVRRQIATRPKECLILQPENKDTGPGVILPLIYLQKRDPAAVAAIFPSDHFILEEDTFMRHVERAFSIAESNHSRLVLLGMEPNEPDPEYGYILPGEAGDNPVSDDRTVEIFIEKPSLDAARTIVRKGALWNTLVLVGACRTLLQAIKRATPELYRSFKPIEDAIGTPDERRLIERVYQSLAPVNFSKSVLETLSHEDRRNLRVLPIRGVTWKDWGSSDRLLKSLRQLGAPDLDSPAVSPTGIGAARHYPEPRVIPLRRTP